MRIFLVRHGETTWNAEGRYQGRTDTQLAPAGLEQVAALGDRLADVAFAYAVASPLQRAQHTAQAILRANRAAFVPTLQTDPDLIEISHGTWEGKLAADVRRDDAEMFAAWRGRPPATMAAGPGGESLAQVGARAAAAVQRACAAAGGENILIVAHDAVNRVILCDALGLAYPHVWSFDQAPATLNTLRGASAGELIVVRLNDASHVCPVDGDRVHGAL